jgi:hypothetical protein
MVNDVNHPIYKKTVEEYILEGNQNYHKGEFKKAIEAYEKPLRLNLMKMFITIWGLLTLS